MTCALEALLLHFSLVQQQEVISNDF